ncbi:hypothetical protein ANANG_G00303890 [Anguilla anguilla]|uniref:Fibroblast growth factor binding protein 3 n=1 Tax=Anguilla anguilla TaxID=7936 RepID=A0A9D3LJM8_ANGAN|nr:hypothetical protein ANANG_G00303890 [Anguilla anguilla]
MRLLSALLFLLLLLLCGPPRGRRRRRRADETQAARRGRNRAVPGSGELTSKEGHRCAWETTGEGAVSLLVSCSYGELAYQCRYAGQPDLCPAYAARSSQYWKQVVGKLKKRRNVCDGEKVLKTRVCKKAPAESHMRLAEEERAEEATQAQAKEEKKKRGKGGGEKKAAGSEGAGKEEEKPAAAAAALDGVAFGEVNDGSMETEPAETYCAEGWQSFCSFFVKFVDG